MRFQFRLRRYFHHVPAFFFVFLCFFFRFFVSCSFSCDEALVNQEGVDFAFGYCHGVLDLAQWVTLRCEISITGLP